MRLESELSSVGARIEADDFRDMIVELFHAHHRNATVADILVRPKLAINFCKIVRRQARARKIDDEVILRTLLNQRKRGLCRCLDLS